MSKKKETALRQQPQFPKDGAITKSTDSSVPNLPADVKDIRNLRLNRNIPVADIVEIVKSIYPRYDRYLHSKVEHGTEYGIRLREDAQRELLAHFKESPPERPKVKQRPNRQKPMRITCHLTDKAYGLLQRELDRTGATIQAYVETLILKDLARRGEDAHSKNDYEEDA